MSGQLCEQPRLIVGAWAGASHGAGAGLWTGSELRLQHLTRARARKWAGAAVIRAPGEMYLGKWCLC